MPFGLTYRCLNRVVQKKEARDKNYHVSKRWECCSITCGKEFISPHITHKGKYSTTLQQRVHLRYCQQTAYI